MELSDIFLIEIKGLTKTICNYTTDDYITSYAEQLLYLKYPEDLRQIKLIIERLDKWYQDNITLIRDNKYIHNLQAHEKSLEIIDALKIGLQ